MWDESRVWLEWFKIGVEKSLLKTQNRFLTESNDWQIINAVTGCCVSCIESANLDKTGNFQVYGEAIYAMTDSYLE